MSNLLTQPLPRLNQRGKILQRGDDDEEEHDRHADGHDRRPRFNLNQVPQAGGPGDPQSIYRQILQFIFLNLLGLGAFEGNVWKDEGKVRMGLFIDERADERQREALQSVFSGQAGGWPAIFATKIGEFRGVEFVPITFEVADDLACWRAEIPGRVAGRANALCGPTTPAGKRVQTINPPGSEVGPGQVATWGYSVELQAEGFGFNWTGENWSSKHIPFDWTGPDSP